MDRQRAGQAFKIYAENYDIYWMFYHVGAGYNIKIREKAA